MDSGVTIVRHSAVHPSVCDSASEYVRVLARVYVCGDNPFSFLFDFLNYIYIYISEIAGL